MTDRVELKPEEQVLASPGCAEAVAARLRHAGDEAAVGWLRRLLTLPGARGPGGGPAFDGDTLSRMLRAAGALDLETVRRLVNAAPERDRMVPCLFAAALLAGRKVDLARVAGMSVTYSDAADRFERTLGALAGDVAVRTSHEAVDVLKTRTVAGVQLRDGGFPGLATAFGRTTSRLSARYQKSLYGDRWRVFSENWTVAIGHMVVLAFLARGLRHGLQGARAARICRGPVANRYLLERIVSSNPGAEVVEPGGLVADYHAVLHPEWIDGRPVDILEACGIIADREGDERGAILDRPHPDDPRLAALFEAAGIGPGDSVATLHCRGAGFRHGAHHDLRNVDVARYLPAVEALAARGFRVVRLGDPSMTPLPAMAGVYDYAHSPLKSPELDVLLPAAARFHVGCSSGLSLVPLLFGTPTLFLNWHPVSPLPWGRRNRTVLRPLRRLGGGRVVDPPVYAKAGRLLSPALLRATGYESEELRAEEVRRAVLGFADDAGRPAERMERNLGEVWMADEGGRFVDCRPWLAKGKPGESGPPTSSGDDRRS